MTEEQAQPAAAKKPETAPYVVIRANTRICNELIPVGQTVDLTDKQAQQYVNKVRPKDQVDAEASKAGRKSKLEKEHAALTEKVKAQELEIAQLKAKLGVQ